MKSVSVRCMEGTLTTCLYVTLPDQDPVSPKQRIRIRINSNKTEIRIRKVLYLIYYIRCMEGTLTTCHYATLSGSSYDKARDPDQDHGSNKENRIRKVLHLIH